jgi:hypothetical protein
MRNTGDEMDELLTHLNRRIEGDMSYEGSVGRWGGKDNEEKGEESGGIVERSSKEVRNGQSNRKNITGRMHCCVVS